MSASPTNALYDTPSPTGDITPTTIMDLRRTESLETLPDISATTLARDKRELSAWYKTQDTPSGCEIQKSFPSSSPLSQSDETDVLSVPLNPQGFVAHRHASLSPASSLTSLESDVETESSLTSLDLDVDDCDSHIPLGTSAGRGAPDSISQTTSTSFSKTTRKRKKSRGQSVVLFVQYAAGTSAPRPFIDDEATIV